MTRLRDAPLVRKLARYWMTSMVGVVIGQSLLFTGHEILEWPVVASNVVSVTVSSVPVYLINRYWVWKKRDRNRLMREVVPFWSMAFLGLLLSSLLVHLADERSDSTLLIQAANLAGFGVLWVGKFLVLDRVLFVVADDDPVLTDV